MTNLELLDILKSDADFFASLPEVQEAVLYGSALMQLDLTDDADLLVIPSRDLSEGEKIDLRQAVWEHFKDKLPVMLEVVTPSEEVSKEKLAAAGVPMEIIFSH